jgi:hypothetical protein
MTDLAFTIVGAAANPYAASPMLVLRLRITESSGAKIDAIALRTQIQLEVQRRRYTTGESALLEELFGSPARYADTLKPMLWTHVSTMVLSFDEETEVELHVPCSYDFEVAAHKYLASLQDGIIPLNLQFSGTAFVERAGTVMPQFVPWSCETRYALPVSVWREAVDASFPNCAWIRVDRDLFDELRRYKIATGVPTWDAAMQRLVELAKAQR